MSPLSHGQFSTSQMLYQSGFNGRDIIHSSSLVSLGWRKWPPTPVFLPRESHGQRSPWGPKSWTRLSDWTTTTTTELLKRLEGPHWAFRNSSENRAAARGDTEGTTIFYKWTLPAGWENIMEIPDSEAMVLASRNSGSSPSVVSSSLLPSGCRNPKCIWEL